MTKPEVNVVHLEVKMLEANARARCALCGGTKHLGRITSPSFDYGIVACERHGPTIVMSMVEAYGGPDYLVEELLRVAGLL